jgi:heme/copper-type cytochrome/quinol oxidase subunit 2
MLFLILTAVFVLVFVAFLVFATIHHRRTWGNETGAVKADREFEPQIWLGQQRG